MTGEDLKRVQDHFIDVGKTLLLESGQLHPLGFIVTLHKHVDKLFEHGWAFEIVDPKACVRDPGDDQIATLVVDLLMDYQRLYGAVVNVFPQTRGVLERMVSLARSIEVDDPYMRVMRPFLAHARMHEKDVIAATMRHLCDKVDAFASIFQSEAWLRTVDLHQETEADVPQSLADDTKAVEVVISSMETYDVTRRVRTPSLREKAQGKQKRYEGKVLGFGESADRIDAADNTAIAKGRFTRFLKPLGVAS